MKKIKPTAFLLILAVLSSICLFGCAEGGEPIEKADYTVAFEEQVFDENGCHVQLKYPVISGLANADNEREINSRLYEYVYSKYKMKGLVSDGDNVLTYETVDAAVTVAIKGYFCVLICAGATSDTSSRGDYFGFTIHCNTVTGELYDSSDIIKNFDGIKKKFESGKFTQQYGLTTLMQDYTYADLMSRYIAEYELYPYVYFEDGKFGVNIDVVHLYGGYAGFTADISEVKAYLNTDLDFINRLAN